MMYQLAQLNIARFIKPAEHAANLDFMNNLDRVNAEAESQMGFVWRLVGDGNDATDIQATDDANMIINVSVWESIDALRNFVYRNEMHRDIMRRRQEWFNQLEIHLVLWWVPAGHQPNIEEAMQRLALLEQNGPGQDAFTFGESYPAPIT